MRRTDAACTSRAERRPRRTARSKRTWSAARPRGRDRSERRPRPRRSPCCSSRPSATPLRPACPPRGRCRRPSLRRDRSGARPRRVIAREKHDLELRQRPRRFVRVELALPLRKPRHVLDRHVERRIVVVGIRVQGRDSSTNRCRPVGRRADHLAVVAQRKAVPHCIVPKIAGMRHRRFGTVFEVVERPPIGVILRPHLLGVVVGEWASGPVMAVGADVRVLEEVGRRRRSAWPARAGSA